MGNDKLRTIPVKDTDAPEFAEVARKVSWPQKDEGRPSQFWPAMSGFNIGSGTDVDISYLESTRSEPSNGFDRHLNTEELFVCLERGVRDADGPLPQAGRPRRRASRSKT